MLEALDLLGEGSRAVVAVSGGPDSAGLAVLVRRARPDLDLRAVHVRHGLRNDAVDRAAAAAVAVALGLELCEVVAEVDPNHREGPEGGARAARYAALRAAAEGAPVLVGHTADDQAETVLLAVGRGTGVRGLGGMRPIHARADGLVVIRPLLHLRRAEVRAAAAGLPTVHDPTNDDEAQRRGRVRREVLPALARLSGGPGDPVALLVRLAALARDDADLLDDLAAGEAARLIRSWGPVRLLRSADLVAVPLALRRRVVRALLAGARDAGTSGLDADSVERALALGARGAVHVAGGVAVTSAAGWLTAAPIGIDDLVELRLPVPGAVALDELGLLLRAAPRSAVAGPGGVASGALPPRAAVPRGMASASWAVVGAPAGSLVVRARRPGDRAPGSRRRLADRLDALGVPRAVRGLVPVVCAPDGAPLWVPGVAVAPTPPAGGIALHLEPAEGADR